MVVGVTMVAVDCGQDDGVTGIEVLAGCHPGVKADLLVLGIC